MKVYAIAICEKSGNASRILTAEQNLAEFGYFQRGRCVGVLLLASVSPVTTWTDMFLSNMYSVSEFMNFFTKTAVERTSAGVRQKIEQERTFASCLL